VKKEGSQRRRDDGENLKGMDKKEKRRETSIREVEKPNRQHQEGKFNTNGKRGGGGGGSQIDTFNQKLKTRYFRGV